jgi:hypothetical protein
MADLGRFAEAAGSDRAANRRGSVDLESWLSEATYVCHIPEVSRRRQ